MPTLKRLAHLARKSRYCPQVSIYRLKNEIQTIDWVVITSDLAGQIFTV